MILVVACGPPPTPSPSPAPTPPTSASAPPAASSTPGGSHTAVTAVTAEPSLLAVVPAAAAGLRLDYDPDTTASVAADPALAADAAALAIGLAVPAGQATPSEFVIVNVVRLRDPGRDETWFRGWRDTYDQGACDQAGGVAGNAQTEFNRHAVFIATCAGGAITYHVRLEDGAIVLSLTSVGPGRPGERVMRALPP
jgi:hypothetical protein